MNSELHFFNYRYVLILQLLFCIYATSACEWSGIRDGTVYIRNHASNAEITISWRAVWAAKGHENTIYIMLPDGGLLEKIVVPKTSLHGSRRLVLPERKGDYRIEIPGRSHRAYSITVPDGIASVFEPVKHHFSHMVSGSETWFFHAPAHTTFRVCGKNHNGVSTLRINDNKDSVYSMVLSSFDNRKTYNARYASHDARTFTTLDSGVWSVTTQGGGKAAVWLDDIPNFFSQKSEHLFIPELDTGNINIYVSKKIAGKAPKIGTTLPSNTIPSYGWPVLSKINPKATQLYTFMDRQTSENAVVKNQGDWYAQYSRKLGTDFFITLFQTHVSPAARVAYQGRNRKKFAGKRRDKFAEFIRRYLEIHNRRIPNAYHCAAVFDEPNRAFDTKEEFGTFFKKTAEALYSKNDSASDGSIVVSVPETAGFVNGPMNSDAHKRTGSEWCEYLLRHYWEHIDAISWHEWNVRDLIATPWYTKSVEHAWRLMNRYRPPGSPEKKIIISQTNISSGYNYSPYEQHTEYAALWLASVVARAGLPGKLSALIWLPGIEHPGIHKGLINHHKGRVTIRPVGYAMDFINSSLYTHVVHSRNPSYEIDVLATADTLTDAYSMLLVNKIERPQKIVLHFNDANDDSGEYTCLVTKFASTHSSVLPSDTIEIDEGAAEMKVLLKTKGIYSLRIDSDQDL